MNSKTELSCDSDLSIRILKHKIRHGLEPDNPVLINLWLSLDEPDMVMCQRTSLYDHYESQFRLLLDTIADELVPSHWRCVCLDSIYKPLCSLEKLADNQVAKQRVKRLFNELTIISRYVESSLN